MEDPRLEAFKRLLDIMDELRLKCPWDKKQTFETLRYLTIEERKIIRKKRNDF